jgi:hypothetical protein
MAEETERIIRVSCSDCGRFRHFREVDLFAGDARRETELHEDIATVTKPCPSCGSLRPVNIQRPPATVPHRAIWAVGSFPIQLSSN